MVKIILYITSLTGIIIAVISKAQNFFLLFVGISLAFSAITATFINKYARYLLTPFIILTAGLLYFFNSMDFQANIFDIDYFDPAGFQSFLRVHDPNQLATPIETPEWAALTESRLNQADQFQIYFHPSPLVNYYYLKLTDFLLENQNLTATWSWADNFHQSQFNGDLRYIVLEAIPESEFDHYEVLVNGIPLAFAMSDGNFHYYHPVNHTIKYIDNLSVIERDRPRPVIFNIQLLDPTIQAVYALGTEPAPIIIDNIHFHKYFGSLNRYLPFYHWDEQAILRDFTIEGGSVFTQHGLLFIDPERLHPTLTYTGSPAALVAEGLKNYQPYILAANIILTILALSAFAGFSLLLNKYHLDLQQASLKVKGTAQYLSEQITVDREIHGMTPFKIVFFLFLLLSWFWLILPAHPGIARNPLTYLFILISLLAAYYVFRDIKISKK